MDNTFKDTQGHEWTVELTLASAMRIDDSDFSALGIEEDFTILEPQRDIFNRILSDRRLAMAVIWAIIAPQVAKVLGDPNDDAVQLKFYEALDGPTMKQAQDVLWGQLTNFFPEQAAVLQSLKQQKDRAEAKITEHLQGMQTDIREAIDSQTDKALTELQKELEELKRKAVGQTSGK